MTTSSPPAGYRSVSPWIITRDTVAEIAFIIRVFGGEEIARVPNDDGTIGHAEVRLGDSVVLLFDSRPSWPPSPSYLRVWVDDAAATFERAVAQGAEAVTRPTEMFWGDIGARVRDPLGNVWWLQQRLLELTPEEMAARAAEPRFVDAMRYAQDATIVR